MDNAFNFSPAMAAAVAIHNRTQADLDDAPTGLPMEEDDRLAYAHFAARIALIECPAETIDDLRAKIDVLWLHPDACPPRKHIDHVFRDLQRMSSQKASAVFRPAFWLNWFEQNGGGWVDQGGEVHLMAMQSERASDALAELRASGACEAVKELIRQRGEAA